MYKVKFESSYSIWIIVWFSAGFLIIIIIIIIIGYKTRLFKSGATILGDTVFVAFSEMNNLYILNSVTFMSKL